MKTLSLILLLTLTINVNDVFAQKDGTFMNKDGYTCVITKINDNKLKVEAGGRSDFYVRESGSMFKCETPNYGHYKIRVGSDTQIFSSKEGSKEVLFEFRDDASLVKNMDDCKMAEKYLEKISTDSPNAQVWSFCSQAALITCSTQPGNGRDQQLSTIVMVMKTFTSATSSPCLDAIPNSIWNKQ